MESEETPTSRYPRQHKPRYRKVVQNREEEAKEPSESEQDGQPATTQTRPRGSAPRRQTKLCKAFQQDNCYNNPCEYLHEFSLSRSLYKPLRIRTEEVFEFALLSELNAAIVSRNEIRLLNIWQEYSYMTYIIKAHIKVVKYAESVIADYPMSLEFIIFGGSASVDGLLGYINLFTSQIHFVAPNVSEVTDIAVAPNEIVFTGGYNGIVNCWYFDGSELVFWGDLDAELGGGITKLAVVGFELVAVTTNGQTAIWDFDFEKFECKTSKKLEVVHVGRVNAVAVMDDRFLFSGGDDGKVNCYDSSEEEACEVININENREYEDKVTSLCISINNEEEYILITGTGNGQILIYKLLPGEAKFVYTVYLHTREIYSIVPYYESSSGINGFMLGSKDKTLTIMAWT